jgi:hypothetical protein
MAFAREQANPGGQPICGDGFLEKVRPDTPDLGKSGLQVSCRDRDKTRQEMKLGDEAWRQVGPPV